MSDKVLYEIVDGGVAVITLNRADQHNAQDWELLDALDAAWAQADQDENVRVILLNANGRNFSAGHDMKAIPQMREHYDVQTTGMDRRYRWEAKHYYGYCQHWRNVSKPSIAAVQGKCIAAGLMLCWPCDLIIASDDAKFSDPVVVMGIGGVEYHGHTWEFGARKAKELLFTGDSITAEEAKELGMVNRVVSSESLQDEALALARKIAEREPFALLQAKRVVNTTLDAMGQTNAMNACFDVHQLGHAHGLIKAGNAVLTNLDGMKGHNAKK